MTALGQGGAVFWCMYCRRRSKTWCCTACWEKLIEQKKGGDE